MDTSKRKPELVSVSRGMQDQGQRILANLEHGGKPVTHRRRAASRQLDNWIVGVSSVVVVLAAFAWIMHDSSVTPKPKRFVWASARGLSAAQAAFAQQAQPDNRSAAIINEPVAPERHGAHSAPTETPASAVMEHNQAPAARAGTLAVRATSASNLPPRAASAASMSAAHATTATVTADTDVALLTALVAHAGRPAAVAPERSRDVVERRESDSTEILLARCKQLGLIEGMLCRSRICSGRWESDAACRAPNH